MNYTQNAKIEQVKETTLVVGIDIGSETHFARGFDWRGRELTKRVFKQKLECLFLCEQCNAIWKSAVIRAMI
ncbi:hypothetical protein SAMN02745243_03239 [Hespellia stercorisuis DSM 15480]|jgi:hypothetical protein|uniref:Transposase n=1 Tax=Hespellia stercorisuis DSM 15480 TaxID=1121950 RepID=A0A1M6TJA3_9FIRM|nr:hypothetical protein [Hespellia stercorisuis]SHK56828.1 hypothetical protein SAMN02745243_03239 [Hespellia stercorisuis DSM 15480]